MTTKLNKTIDYKINKYQSKMAHAKNLEQKKIYVSKLSHYTKLQKKTNTNGGGIDWDLLYENEKKTQCRRMGTI